MPYNFAQHAKFKFEAIFQKTNLRLDEILGNLFYVIDEIVYNEKISL
jgi:hypothetical protein